jgi:hypothetical protein
MKRFLLALTVFLTATVTPAFSGYIIIRVLLEGGSGGTTGGGGDKGLPPLGIPDAGMGAPKGGPPPMPGGGPGPGGMPPGPGGPATASAEIDHSRSVVVVVPLEADFLKQTLDLKSAGDQNPIFNKFNVYHYGKRYRISLFADTTSIQLYSELLDKPKAKESRNTEMRAKYNQWLRTKTDPQLLYDALVLALESGYIREQGTPRDLNGRRDALAFAKELLAFAADKKGLPPRVERFVTAWEKMEKAVLAPAAPSGDGEQWKFTLNATEVRTEGHYAVVYWDKETPESEVARRSVQLNDNFAAYFLHHATRGVALPVPNKPLVAVIAKQGQAVHGLRYALDGLPIQADAFFAPDHDVLVLSPERMDNVGQTFIGQAHKVFVKGLDRAPLLDGQVPTLDWTGQKGARHYDVARASTMALVEKLVIDEAEIAAVSREGSRQLMFATGNLPKHVTLPNWLTNGAANVFSRPRGPAYVTVGEKETPFMHVAFSTGYGVPNYVLHRYFRDLDVKKELNADRARLLQNVLADAYFNGIKAGDDPDPAPPSKPKPGGGPPKVGPGGGSPLIPGGGPGPIGSPPGTGGGPPPMPGGGPGPPPMPGGGPGPGIGQSPSEDGDDPVVVQRKKRERLTIKAQATSWALYYFLANEKPALLEKYIRELNKLPRDLPIDGRTAQGVFVRVFDLAATPGGAADPERMKKFAKDWFDYMNTVPPAGFDVPLIVPEPTTTPNPNGPGGGPGPPPMPR